MFLVGYLVCLFSGKAIAVEEDKKIVQSPSVAPATIPQNNAILPVGLNINGKSVLPSMNVRGKEDGEKAIEFERWLVPWEEIKSALNLKVGEPINEQIEIKSTLFKFNLDANKLVKDPVLGTAIAIQDLNTIPGITAKFDINKYAIDITAPAIDRAERGENIVDRPIDLDGLPVMRSGNLSMAALQQRITTSGQSDQSSTNQGEFKAIGSIFDASWFLTIQQPKIDGLQTWKLDELTILRQRPQSDIAIGSQTPFWSRGSSSGNYWGVTGIFRNGFTPPVELSGSDFLVTDRLQSSRVGRVISGRAQPGSLVQLVRGFETTPIREILIDSSGIYRFENVIVGNGQDSSFGQDYRVLIYPNGQLTANPFVQEAKFITTPGQIPVGSSALVVSAGLNRTPTDFFGTFSDPKGGALYRWGANESLTLGVGVVSDPQAGANIGAIGELFWQPDRLPLQVSAAVSTGDRLDLVGKLNYTPSQDFFLSANTDRFSTRADANWRLTPNFTTFSNIDTSRGVSIGGQYYTSDSIAATSTSLRGDIDDRLRMRLAATQRFQNWQLGLQLNESAITSQVSYQLNPKATSGGSEITASYQANNSGTNSSSTLTSLVWRYRSPGVNANGQSIWQSELGYGFSSTSSGAIVGIDFYPLPGFQVRGSYRGGSETGGSSYAIEFNASLLTGGGIRGTDNSIDEFRNLGRISMSGFLDKNNNGKRDAGEEVYVDPLLYRINNKPLNDLRPEVADNGVIVKLPPNSYRLDIDPAGYPINYRSSIDAIRVDVIAGSNVAIDIPLVPAYIYTGVVADKQGKAVAGATVAATSIKTKTKITSVTNDAGVYYLEGLEQGEYQLTIS
ncbi:carboxypeptidase regulatory-like domain-containing protein, partial [Chamaesiphon polymorphus]